jgi:hypothetical protein
MKNDSDAKREILERRKIARSGATRAIAENGCIGNDGPKSHHTEIANSILGIENRNKGAKRIAEVGAASNFYSPGYRIAAQIQNAMSADQVFNSEVKASGEMGAGTRTRGRIIERDDYRVKIEVYGSACWANGHRVTDNGDGTLHILHLEYVRNRVLKFLQRKHNG